MISVPSFSLVDIDENVDGECAMIRPIARISIDHLRKANRLSAFQNHVLDHRINAGILETYVLNEVSQGIASKPSHIFLIVFPLTGNVVWSDEEHNTSIEPFDPYGESFIVRFRHINNSVFALGPFFL